MNDKTIEGVLAYCQWLLDKGYAGPSQIRPWKIALQKVFETTEGDGYLSTSIEGLDLDDVIRRFRTLAAQTYKAESIDAYANRVRRALEAHEFYLENHRPPTFRQVGS